MLAEIDVENFALIENLHVEFHPGLNVITGQTGAGKSLLTDAVGMLMGGKGDKDLIRQGTGKALVKGIFSGPFSGAVEKFCADNQFQNEEIVISREMNSDGKNMVRLNGKKITLALLEQLSPLLMNIHSQTEHFSLFREEEQLLLLDRFGGEELADKKAKVNAAYAFWQEKKKKLTELKNKINDKEKRLDYLLYQKKEIEALQLQVDEDEALRREIDLLSSSANRYQDAQLALSLITGNEEGSLIDGLFQGQEAVARIAAKDPELTGLAAALSDLYYSLVDAGEELRAYGDGIEIDPLRLEEAESRLSEIRKAEKKYHMDIAGILQYEAEINEEITAYEDADFLLEKAEREEKDAFEGFFAEAESLTALRFAAGKRLSAAIEEQLKDMMLPNSRFDVVLREAPLASEGKDSVTYMATMNKGEALRPLAKVASGGEISRVLLAAKIILGKLDAVQTMIFDEIDSGLGGETASRVGEKLLLLGKDIQVLAVTHSPLVAANADHHYYIEKQESKERVVVHLEELKQEERRHEIARMLSGDPGSKVSLQQADALLSAVK